MAIGWEEYGFCVLNVQQRVDEGARGREGDVEAFYKGDYNVKALFLYI